MSGSLKLAVLFLVGLFALAGCGKYVPEEPALNTGTVFQKTPEVVQAAARNALSRLNFAITQETGDYIEAVHLRQGETVDDNKGEIAYIWIKPRDSNAVVLIYTRQRSSGIAKQKYWDEMIIAKMIEEMQ